jgi:putative chitinase
MKITLAQLAAIIPNATTGNRAKYLDAINDTMAAYDIDTELRVAHYLAQIGHETIDLSATTEGLYYSVDALLKTFSRARISVEQANALGYKKDAKGNVTQKANPEGIANQIYGGAWGLKNLGNREEGDGWKFRGRGAIQTTGRSNYTRAGHALGIDLANHPELLAEPKWWARSSGLFWAQAGLNAYADKNDIVGLRKKANGGSLGLEDVKLRFARAAKVLGIDAKTGKPLAAK